MTAKMKKVRLAVSLFDIYTHNLQSIYNNKPGKRLTNSKDFNETNCKTIHFRPESIFIITCSFSCSKTSDYYKIRNEKIYENTQNDDLC